MMVFVSFAAKQKQSKRRTRRASGAATAPRAQTSSPARLGRNKWYNTDIGNKRRMNTMELNGPKEDLLSI